MIDKPQMKDSVILQQAWQQGPFSDMLRLTYQRHASYAWAHNMEYIAWAGSLKPDMWPGGWGKIWLIRLMLEQGYKNVFWIDTDAAIVSECDLRDALPADKYIGACEHDAPWFPQMGIPKHYNVGVLFVRNSPLVCEFMDDWIGRYPGHQRWLEQGAFNAMVAEDKYASLFHRLDDRWNATYNVNQAENPYIMGWHGIMPEAKRYSMMKEVFKDDFLKFRV